MVNPARVESAGLMRGQGNKTDRADARLIAESADRERPAAWHPPRPDVRELQAFSRWRDDLRRLAAAEKRRLAAPGLAAAFRTSLAGVVAFLGKEADRLQAQADAVIAADGRLRADGELLRTIPGVGPVAAHAILAELPDPSRFATAQQAAASAGLAPRERVPLRHQCPQAHPAVQGRQRPPPQGTRPARPDGDPVQPPRECLLRPAGGGREAEDERPRRVHEEAPDDRRRRAQESHAIRPGEGVKNHPLTIHHLVRPDFLDLRSVSSHQFRHSFTTRPYRLRKPIE